MVEHQLPTGTVTFLLTDIEGSTKLWQHHDVSMGRVVARHEELISTAVTEHGGVFLKSKGEGDSTFSVFAKPSDAVAAAIALQRLLRNESWPDGIDLRARTGLHTGEAELREGDYFGTTVNRCARIKGIAHGEQIVCSQTTADLLAGMNVAVRSLGLHRLKDLERPEHVFQVGEGDFPPLRSLDAFRHNLPQQRTTFVGRDDELRRIRKLIGDNRLVTLTGVGGCGKTRIALQIAAESLDDFEDGVFFVELAPLSDPDAIPGAIAGALAFSSGAGMPDGTRLYDEVLSALSVRTLLLVLDNCEHLVDGCSELADDILAQCPSVRVLATSREALEVSGEHTHTVASLGLPGEDDFETSESVRLFFDRAGAVREGFTIDGSNATAVAEICLRLDGIPLAIELAAGQIAHLSPSQIASRLDDRFELLTGGRRRVQRQHTLAATLDWSHDLLSEDERVLLRRLSVFPGDFSLEAAEAVAGSGLRRPVELLGSLVAKSLVVVEEGEVLRYRLLETVRLYAGEKLIAADEAEPVRTAHRDYFLAWIESRSEDDCWTRGFLDPESNNLYTALAWSEREGRIDLVGRMVGLMRGLAPSDPATAARWLDLALTDMTALDDDQRGRILCARGELGIALVDRLHASGLELARQAAALNTERPSMWSALAHAQVAFQGMWPANYTDRDEALVESRFHEEVALRLAVTDAAKLAVTLYLAYAYANRYELERSLELFERVAERTSIAGVFMRSMLCHLLGRHDEALEIVEHPFDAVPTPMTVSLVGIARGLALAGVGRIQDGLQALRDTAEGISFSFPGVEVAAASVLGALAVMAEDWERAAVVFGSVKASFDLGILRSPGDVLIYGMYVPRVREALGSRGRELRDRGYAMSITDAVAYGLELETV